jgi:hypothetical protein
VIKQQPQEGCLSTLEAVHELLMTLERSGLDRYDRPTQLLEVFQRMQDFQLKCAADLTRPGYRRRAYRTPEERLGPQGRVGKRRMKFLKAEAGSAAGAESRPLRATTPISKQDSE